MSITPIARVYEHLTFLYGPERGRRVAETLLPRLERFRIRHPDLQQAPPPAQRLTERDSVLITYGDQVRDPTDPRPPLALLGEVLRQYAAPAISIVHLLPFFPYSSDDGFSVIDYTAVNPEWGTWEDVERLRRDFRLMFDAVINHISRHSAWFQAFLDGDPAFEHAFITVEPGTDLSLVVRPRALPLLTEVQTVHGPRMVWTTFSADQIDLNYADPSVLLRIIDVLLTYVAHGAEIIRLDAIAYLWKKIGTSCIHLEETHRVVKLFRAILDLVAPGVMLITETNVPHQENISYFGDGTDEAQLVYQFPLPPLVRHTFVSGDATHLTAWAAALEAPSEGTTFYNFLASHDGIGVRPVEGILTPREVDALVQQTLRHGGFASYKTNSDGSQSVYELNINYFDALSDPAGAESRALQIARFVVAHSIMFTLQGVPAIYVHSLFGSRSDRAAVEHTGVYRAINRAKFDRSALDAALADPGTLRAGVYRALRKLLMQRREHPAFHPNAPQRILSLGTGVFAVAREAPQERILALHNVTACPQRVHLSTVYGLADGEWRDLLSDLVLPSLPTTVTLQPYQILWLRHGERTSEAISREKGA